MSRNSGHAGKDVAKSRARGCSPPRRWPTERKQTVDKGRIRETARAHKLVRVDETGNEEAVATFATFSEGWAEGQHLTHTEPESAFSLYRGKRRIARFGHNRLASNDATANLDAMVL